MDLVYLFRVLMKRKWLIIGSAVLAGLIAWFFTRNQPKYFRSRSRVSTGFTISDDIKVNPTSYSFYEADTKFGNVIVTATSPSVTILLSYVLILHDLQSPKPFRVLTEEQKQSAAYKAITKEQAIAAFKDRLETMTMLTSFKPEEQKLLDYLDLYGYKNIGNNLSVYRLDRTDYIQIDYVSENPELSAFVVNNIFQQFMRYYRGVRSSSSQESIDTLRSLMEKKKHDLDVKNALLGGQGLVDANLQSGSKLDLIANLEQVLTDEKGRLTMLQSSLLKVEQRLRNVGSTGTGTTRTNNNDELLALRKAKNEAYSEYLNSGSTDKALLDKYNRLNAEYQNKMVNNNPVSSSSASDDQKSATRENLLNQKNDLEIDIEASNKNIRQIEAKIGGLKGTVVSDASHTASVETLMKEADLANKEYLNAKQKYNDATDINNSSVNNFRQVVTGQPAIDPEPSKRKVIVAMAAIGTMLVIMLVIVLLAYLDSSIKTPVIFSKQINLRLISMVNFADLQQKNLYDILATKGISDNPDQKRHNVFRESIRKLRYEIEQTGKKIFLFTSTKKSMGKTTLIQALSYSFRFSKKKVLIIDTNFCNNDLTVQMKADPVLEKMSPGNIIDEKTLLEEVKNAAVDIGGDGYIHVIGSEGGDYTPSEILPQQNLLQHLRTLTKHYDYIFLEGPPLNDFSDSKELAQYVDGVIGVFSATHSMKVIDKESIKFFRELNGKFSGAILNKIELENINVA